LFARLGTPYCPLCGIPVSTQTLDEIVDTILSEPRPEGREKKPQPSGRGSVNLIAAPLHVEVGHNYDDVWKRLRADGFHRVRIDGTIFSLENLPEIDRRRKHDVELIIEAVNENALYAVGDNIIECIDGQYSIYNEYRDEIREALKAKP
jgi:excinuclease ABC subunit A